MLTQTHVQTSGNVAPPYVQSLSIFAVALFDFLISMECAGIEKFRGKALSHVSNILKILWS